MSSDDTKKKHDSTVALAYSDLSKLLSLFMFLPSREMTDDVFNGLLFDDISCILKEAEFSSLEHDRHLGLFEGVFTKALSSEEQLSVLRREYTRLFSHPAKPVIMIYESLYCHNPKVDGPDKPMFFVNSTAMDVERRYKKAGLDLSQGVSVPGDHMGVELDFLAYLFQAKAKALQEGDPSAVKDSDEQIEALLESHLSKWALPFFMDVENQSEHSFYKAIGALGTEFMQRVLSASGL